MDLNALMGTLLSGDAVSNMSQLTGASQEEVQSVLTSALPAMLNGAQAQANDKETAEGLKITQRHWIKYRNNQCENNGTIQLQCNYEVNKNRTDYLRERLRECKSGVCQNSLVVKPSW